MYMYLPTYIVHYYCYIITTLSTYTTRAYTIHSLTINRQQATNIHQLSWELVKIFRSIVHEPRLFGRLILQL